jgi:hypothetical protein
VDKIQHRCLLPRSGAWGGILQDEFGEVVMTAQGHSNHHVAFQGCLVSKINMKAFSVAHGLAKEKKKVADGLALKMGIQCRVSLLCWGVFLHVMCTGLRVIVNTCESYINKVAQILKTRC